MNPPSLRDEASALEPAFGNSEAPIIAYSDEPEIARIKSRSTGATAVARPSRRRRKDKIRTRMLMLAMLASMGAALGGIWALVPVRSSISGTVTFLNYDYTPESNDGIQFESSQRKLLADPQMRMRASIFSRSSTPVRVTASSMFLIFIPASPAVLRLVEPCRQPPRDHRHADPRKQSRREDKAAMGALIQALIVADSGTIDDNRRLRAEADSASQALAEARQKLEQINRQIAELEANVANQPPLDTLTSLTEKKAELEAERRAAENAADADRQEILRLQAAGAGASDPQGAGGASAGQTNSGVDAAILPIEADPQLEHMQQHLADLNANLVAARADEASGATLARAA